MIPLQGMGLMIRINLVNHINHRDQFRQTHGGEIKAETLPGCSAGKVDVSDPGKGTK